jgi:hypothetical protein
MAFCGNCGNELREGAKFCPKCGTDVNGYQDQQETKGKRFSTPWIAAFAVLTILIGSYFVTDMVSPETHNKIFGWVTFGNSPSNTVKKAFSCLMKYDLEGYLGYVYFGKNLSQKEIEGKKALLLAFGREKIETEMEKKGGLKDVKIISEKIDGEIAAVEVETYFGNGDKNKSTIKLKKNIDGKWLMETDD